MITVTLIHQSSITPDLLDWARVNNHAGNPAQVIALGEYVYTTTISAEAVQQYAIDNGVTVLMPVQGEDESTEAYVSRMKPVMLQAFADLKAGTLMALHLSAGDFLLMQSQPEWPVEVQA